MATKKTNLYYFILTFGENTSKENLDNLICSIKDIFKSFAMKVISDEQSSIMSLAYKVKKNTSGFFYILSVEFMNEQTSIKKIIFNKIEGSIRKISGKFLLKMTALRDDKCKKIFSNSPNV